MPSKAVTKVAEKRTVSLITVDFSGGQGKRGVDLGPYHMIEFGLLDQIKTLGWKVELDVKHPHYQKLRPEEDPDVMGLKQPRFVSRVTHEVAQVVKGHMERGHLALTLGGDHSIALGTISGSTSVYPDLCVVWVDAHGDINTPQTTRSGNLHGCPLSFLLGIAGDVPEFEWVPKCLDFNSLVYIGLRDLDDGEKMLIRKHNIKAFSMHEVDKYGIGKVVEMALDHVNPKRDRPIHLSFDVDALDPSVAPSTGTPVRGGLTFREGHFICEEIAETGLLVALDLVEVNPSLGDQSSLYETVAVGCSLVRSSLGETLL